MHHIALKLFTVPKYNEISWNQRRNIRLDRQDAELLLCKGGNNFKDESLAHFLQAFIYQDPGFTYQPIVVD